IFNVINYGAVADGKTDNTQAFANTWNDACEYHGRSRVMIPYGTFVLGSITFVGYCNGSMAFVIKGILKAPTDPVAFVNNTWIGFRYVYNLTLKGGGYLDGQGAAAWHYNDCSKNSHCSALPVTLRFDFVTNSKVHHLRSINSKNAHVNLFACYNMSISQLNLLAPGDSPNTDGINIGNSARINISRSIIKTGDDCIVMVSGSRDIDISDVWCGPGHGISIGSLGRGPQRENVNRIRVRNCSFVGTQNGLRIKTWAPSLYSLASDMSFEDIIMLEVQNPIFIDQNYCPYPPCGHQGELRSSSVEIRNITLNNIRGTSSTKVAMKINCSGSVPCKDIVLRDIDLTYNMGHRKLAATSNCSNAFGSTYGIQNPPTCL
ncbi:hypothetical protein RD792_012494, partial [Penstemon davidsonii]